jgi:hypothetical protein
MRVFGTWRGRIFTASALAHALAAHVGMIPIAAGNKPSRLLNTSPNRTREGAKRQVLNTY